MSTARPLADANTVSLAEVMVELRVGRMAALRLVEGLPTTTVGRVELYLWGDVIRRAFADAHQPAPKRAAVSARARRTGGDWC